MGASRNVTIPNYYIMKTAPEMKIFRVASSPDCLTFSRLFRDRASKSKTVHAAKNLSAIFEQAWIKYESTAHPLLLKLFYSSTPSKPRPSRVNSFNTILISKDNPFTNIIDEHHTTLMSGLLSGI